MDYQFLLPYGVHEMQSQCLGYIYFILFYPLSYYKQVLKVKTLHPLNIAVILTNPICSINTCETKLKHEEAIFYHHFNRELEQMKTYHLCLYQIGRNFFFFLQLQNPGFLLQLYEFRQMRPRPKALERNGKELLTRNTEGDDSAQLINYHLHNSVTKHRCMRFL